MTTKELIEKLKLAPSNTPIELRRFTGGGVIRLNILTCFHPTDKVFIIDEDNEIENV